MPALAPVNSANILAGSSFVGQIPGRTSHGLAVSSDQHQRRRCAGPGNGYQLGVPRRVLRPWAMVGPSR